MTMYDYETRHNAVAVAAWETWTNNGLDLDLDEREQTTKSARDAATNTYVEGIDDTAWWKATVARLRGQS
jgi:hypothetical protein